MKITKLEIIIAIFFSVIMPFEAVSLPLIYSQSSIVTQGILMVVDFTICILLIMFLKSYIEKRLEKRSITISW